jgi:hypothetical protein
MSLHRQICITLSSDSRSVFFFAGFADDDAATELLVFSLSADFLLIAVDPDIEARTKTTARIVGVTILYMV